MKALISGLIPCAMGFLLFAAAVAGVSAQEQATSLSRFLPGVIDGWKPASADEVYSRDQIFEYIDGAGEVYSAYNYRSLLARRYAKPGWPDIIADFFDMGTAADAFGAFTHGLEGERLDIGQGAASTEGQVSFWKDRYFVSLYAETETPEVRRALLDLGGAIAGAVPGKGKLPEILALFPEGFDVRPARTHYWAGMGSCIKNYIMFVPQPSSYYGDACADLATIWSLPLVKDKTRLNVLVMLTPLFHSVGPHDFSRDYVWSYSGILVSRDPVAVDATGFRILQAKRRKHFGEDRPLETSAHHIALADTRHHLGVSDPARIDLVKLGWQESILI